MAAPRLPFAVRVAGLRVRRHVSEALHPQVLARQVAGTDDFPVIVARHTSPLKRVPDGAMAAFSDEKEHNLRLAARRLDGLVIAPGEVFSFCRTVGKTTRWRGYRGALELRHDKLVAAVGGGLCQLANLLYLVALDVDAEIVERHHHSVDLFRDVERTVPFGLGATVFYNYLDLRFRTTLPFPVRLGVRVEPPLLVCEVRARQALPFRVRVVETDQRFFRRDGVVYRANRVWRVVEGLAPQTEGQGDADVPASARRCRRELLMVNEARVLYEADDLVDGTGRPRQ